MVQQESRLRVADNTGAKEPEKLPRIQNSWQLLFLCFVLVFTIIFRLILLCSLLLMSNW